MQRFARRNVAQSDAPKFEPHLIAAGAHLEEIKDHLGHASIRTTSDRYGHLYQAARDRLRDHLDDTYMNASEATVSTA